MVITNRKDWLKCWFVIAVMVAHRKAVGALLVMLQNPPNIYIFITPFFLVCVCKSQKIKIIQLSSQGVRHFILQGSLGFKSNACL